MYSWPPVSGGSLARFRIETLARPPPARGSQPSVLSSLVITCARTLTRKSLKKIKEEKKKQINFSLVSLLSFPFHFIHVTNVTRLGIRDGIQCSLRKKYNHKRIIIIKDTWLLTQILLIVNSCEKLYETLN